MLRPSAPTATGPSVPDSVKPVPAVRPAPSQGGSLAAAVLLALAALAGATLAGPALAQAAAPEAAAAAADSAPAPPSAPPSAPSAAAGDEDPVTGDVERRIRPGDTLERLSRRELDHPERWRDVAAYNGIANPRRIRAGVVVKIKREWLKTERVVATVESVGGAALVDGRPAKVGATVVEGAHVETRSEETVVLSLPDGTQLRIAPDSQVRIERLRAYHSDRAIEALIQLEHGGVEPTSPPQRPRPLEIRTPAGNAAVRGTTFRVRAEQQDGFIEVLTGSIAASSKAGDATVDASTGAVVSPVKAPAVENLLPAPWLGSQWPLPLRMPRFDLALPLVAGAAGYRVEVARDAGFVDLLRAQVVNEPKVEVMSDRDGPLHVRVRAISTSGIEGFDSVATVMVAARPLPPALTARAEPEDPLDGPVTLSWARAEPGQRYLVQLASDATFDQLLGETLVTGAAATLELPPSPTPVLRYWRVASVDAETGHQGPFSPAQPLQQRAPASIEVAVPVPTWRDASGGPLRSGFGSQVLPGY